MSAPDAPPPPASDPGEALALRAAAVVAGLRGLVPPPQRRVDGIPGGVHRGARRGGGMEFAEHREYAPGDDLRHVDWRAYARNDRYYVKRFEQEVHASITLVLDASASMTLPGAPAPDKLATVRLLCAALATLTVRRGDAVGLVVAGRSIELAAAGGESHLRRVIGRLANVPALGPASLQSLDRRLLRGADRRGALVAVSDVLVDPAAAIAPLARIRRIGQQVVLLHTLHPLELDLGFSGPVELYCAESEIAEVVDPRALRGAYRDLMQRHIDEVRDRAARAGIAYRLAVLDRDPGELVRLAVSALASGRGGRSAGATAMAAGGAR